MPKDETKSLLNHTKKPPPPAYSAYFDDPATMYAQIDHCNYSKSSTATLLGSSGQSLNNGSLKTAVGGSVMMTEHGTPHQYNHQLISPLTHTSSSNPSTMLIGGGTTPTYTSLTTSATASPYQSNNYHTQTLPLTSNNKQFLRDLVTVKTPLSFSEQESCV
jgi:hypothetical protein